MKRYEFYRELLRGRGMPLAFVDLDALEANADRVARESRDKTVRVVSKSVRSVDVLRRILGYDDAFEGIMSFTADEAVFLAENGFDDILVAYPVWNLDEIRSVCRSDADITLVVDSSEHVERIARVAVEEGETVPICIDIDMSVDYPGLRFGVYRSGIRTADDAVQLASTVEETDRVSLDGVMGYEAQIAGLADSNPSNSAATNATVRLLKRRSKPEVRDRRASVVDALKDAGYAPRFVNGGGTGSLGYTAADDSVTEVAVGSGFYYPRLFDYHGSVDHEPAAGYAVEVTRKPTDDVYTCRGGGYVASGPTGVDKAPAPVLPEGAELTREGAGEVQTPVRYDGNLELGDPVVFRHAKAGELCERFDSLLLVDSDGVADEVPTYRGDGRCFL